MKRLQWELNGNAFPLNSILSKKARLLRPGFFSNSLIFFVFIGGVDDRLPIFHQNPRTYTFLSYFNNLHCNNVHYRPLTSPEIRVYR